MIRNLLWRLALRPRLEFLWRSNPDAVVLPNDAAFPYDRIAASLRTRDTPFVLIQEGIRFELQGVESKFSYGSAGAQAIAAWGPSSAKYFRSAGAPADRIHLTGNPRFDSLDRLESTRPAASKTLLLVTNPVDTLGLCSSDEKYSLVRRFIDGCAEFLEDGTFDVTIRIHSGESEQAYREAISSTSSSAAVSFDSETDLHELLHRARATVILASTVGLESLLLGVPLGVIEIPGRGFVFDYVSGGAARGLTWKRPLAPQVQALLSGEPLDTREYLASHLAVRKDSGKEVARLISSIAVTNTS
jgi:hypothetical protein